MNAILSHDFHRHLDGQLKLRCFICGCAHSGTTLIANIFASHPSVFIPLYETAIFVEQRNRGFGLLHRLTPQPARQREQRRQAYRLLEQEALFRSKECLFEKTPLHIRSTDLIRASVPRARFVIPVRDGRDVAYSLYKRSGRLDKGIRKWIRDADLSLSQRNRPDAFVYHHEDLVRLTETVLNRICEFLGIDFHPDMLKFHEAGRRWFTLASLPEAKKNPEWFDHREKRNRQVNQPIFDSSGRWAGEFKESDFAPLYHGEGLRIMRAFGYLD
jgi:hypothetical protein